MLIYRSLNYNHLHEKAPHTVRAATLIDVGATQQFSPFQLNPASSAHPTKCRQSHQSRFYGMYFTILGPNRVVSAKGKRCQIRGPQLNAP